MLVTAVSVGGLYADDAKYLDNYTEEARLFGVAGEKEHIDRRLKTPGFTYDFADKKVGDFSVTYSPAASKEAAKFGFMSSLWGLYPKLDDRFSLDFFLKTEQVAHSSWTVQLVDDEGKTAKGILDGVNTGGEWKAFSIALAGLKREASFDLNAIKLCEFQASDFAKDALIKFDFVRFENDSGTVIGITDKTIDQRIAEQQASKEIRIRKAFDASAQKAHKPIISAFAMLYLNQDLAEANRFIREDCEDMVDKDPWSLLTTPMYCRLYFLFSNRCGQYQGRLEPETEKLLLETIWERTKHKNDIHWARQSTWYMDGSENHDLNAKACNLVSSRIFMNEPDYKDRVYPDYGFGGGYHYGRAGYYGKGVDASTREGGGRANLSDGKEYTAEDHYNEWLSFLKEYFRERAKHGFFLENSSSTYAKHTMNMVDLAYAYCGDDELHQIIDDFMTLYWADYVQTGIAGISGGPKTRHHGKVGGYDANTGMLTSLLGGPADAGIWNYWSNVNGYELPKVVQMMALDREGMGNFTYQSRGIGESEPAQPRPQGTERTLIVNPESKFLKYSYVTPSYTLNTQMDHPWALHSHLSKSGRWHGMTVAQDAKARIVPVYLPTEPDFRGGTEPFSLEGMYKTFQHKNALIVQRSRSFSEVNPDWYPLYKQRCDQGVYIGDAWDEQIEQGGWIFLRRGEAYAGIRVALRDKAYEDEKFKKSAEGTQKHFHGPEDDATVKLLDKPYSYTDDRKFLVLKDRFSPVIIQAGDRQQFGSFEAFMAQTQQAPIALHKTVVPGFNILLFTPPVEDAPEMVFNAANNEIPMLDNDYINYEHPMTFDSPYIESEYRSGKIHIEYGGEVLKLDFDKTTVKDERQTKDDDRMNRDKMAFEEALAGDWQVAFSDDCTGDYEDKWFLDGEIAAVRSGEDGMRLTAGPQVGNDAHHMVLWTKEEFAGDLKIEFDYTRTDLEFGGVNIIYIQATGMGKDPYVEDISQWRHLRKVPSMAMYHDYMNTYHISYAVSEPAKDYVRARRYVPKGDDVADGLGKGLESTDLEPDYFNTGLFAPGVPHHLCIIKKGQELSMKVSNPERTMFFHWKNTTAPGIEHGRIGLRHMFTRSATYKNFTVSRPGK